LKKEGKGKEKKKKGGGKAASESQRPSFCAEEWSAEWSLGEKKGGKTGKGREGKKKEKKRGGGPSTTINFVYAHYILVFRGSYRRQERKGKPEGERMKERRGGKGLAVIDKPLLFFGYKGKEELQEEEAGKKRRRERREKR